ncbi:MAG: outer membrane beta-barrel protein [Myxococcales bacterium]|nr:outer membrane beta-barrel protein [Myxococcales bacterium]
MRERPPLRAPGVLAAALVLLGAPAHSRAAAPPPDDDDVGISEPPPEPSPGPSPSAAPPPVSIEPASAGAPMSSADAPPPAQADGSAGASAGASAEGPKKPASKASTKGARGERRSSARDREARPAGNAAEPRPASAPVTVKTGEGSTLTLGGYIETFYGYNFGRPSNGLTNFRAFDNRHNALTLQNVALSAAWEAERVYAKIALQAGHAPATYYGVSEPSQLGSDGASTSDALVFRNIQEANAGVRPFARAPLFIEAGIFLSPIGFESLAIHENWHWSHSPLFFALPFYHSGVKVGADVKPGHQVKLALYNGWNNAVDNNPEKSLGAEYNFTPSDRFALAAVYFTGVERPVGAPEGRAWRHVLNLAARGAPLRRLGLAGDANLGLEPNAFGLSRWLAFAGSARVEALPWLFIAGRGSLIHEVRAMSGAGTAAPIVVANYGADPIQWTATGTFTLDLRPVPDHFGIKLEYRHDHARSDLYFRGMVAGDGSAATPWVANARFQDTLTLGVHAWF